MMLAKPTVTGAMMLAVVVAFASGWWQRDTIQRAYVPEAAPEEVAEITESDEPEEVAEADEPQEPEERAATAPARVVDSAGFPVTEGPIVTVNGRPLGSDEPYGPQPLQTASSAGTGTGTGTEAETTPAETETAAVEMPPIPVPRPADLPEPPRTASVSDGQQDGVRAGQRIDYEAITAAAHGQSRSSVEFMSREDRERLAPIPNEPGYAAAPASSYDPRTDGLVEVVTANGDVIWVYQDQVDRRGAELVGPVNRGSNPLGFVYDSFDYRW